MVAGAGDRSGATAELDVTPLRQAQGRRRRDSGRAAAPDSRGGGQRVARLGLCGGGWVTGRPTAMATVVIEGPFACIRICLYNNGAIQTYRVSDR